MLTPEILSEQLSRELTLTQAGDKLQVSIPGFFGLDHPPLTVTVTEDTDGRLIYSDGGAALEYLSQRYDLEPLRPTLERLLAELELAPTDGKALTRTVRPEGQFDGYTVWRLSNFLQELTVITNLDIYQ